MSHLLLSEISHTYLVLLITSVQKNDKKLLHFPKILRSVKLLKFPTYFVTKNEKFSYSFFPTKNEPKNINTFRIIFGTFFGGGNKPCPQCLLHCHVRVTDKCCAQSDALYTYQRFVSTLSFNSPFLLEAHSQ